MFVPHSTLTDPNITRVKKNSGVLGPLANYAQFRRMGGHVKVKQGYECYSF